MSLILVRRVAVLAAAAFALAANGLAAGGQSPAEFAADSDAYLRVAGWAFSIWGPLYLGLGAFAVWQTLRRSDGPLLDLLGWPAALACLGIGGWLLAAAADLEVLTVVLIVSAATALTLPMWVRADRVQAARGLERALVVWALAALAGWLTIASPVNLVTVLAGNGDLPGPPLLWTAGAAVVVGGLGLLVSRRTGAIGYGLAIAWGLAGVAAAEWARNSSLAVVAAAWSAANVLWAVQVFQRSRAFSAA